jgi:hypothetical protein
MTKRSEAARRELERDIESYACGEVPSAPAMMRAARVEQWYVMVRRRGKESVMVIRGEVRGHPEIPDGESIQTSAIVWFDRKNRFVRTGTRLYVLGEPVGREIPIEGIDV